MTDWYTYESKAGLPLYHDGKKIKNREALVEGMEVTFHDGIACQRTGTVVKLGYDLVVDDGNFIFNLVFEEGFWGHRGGTNHRSVRVMKVGK